MGYSYTVNWRTGRRLLDCDVCGKGEGKTRRRRCPHGWCVSAAICADCWADPAVRQRERAYHEPHCREGAAEVERTSRMRDYLLARGTYVRVSAISAGADGVRVTFRNRDGDEVHAIMSDEKYRSVPLNHPATLPDYGLDFNDYRTTSTALTSA